eukprot:9041550-Lingulodinium_polyedra.AAC.1
MQVVWSQRGGAVSRVRPIRMEKPRGTQRPDDENCFEPRAGGRPHFEECLGHHYEECNIAATNI